jgi:hypothetical protein
MRELILALAHSFSFRPLFPERLRSTYERIVHAPGPAIVTNFLLYLLCSKDYDLPIRNVGSRSTNCFSFFIAKIYN